MSDELERLRQVELFAWLGEDEHGSGEIGLKQALVPAGYIPLVAVHQDKVAQEYLRRAMAAQAATYGKTIRLCRYQLVEVLETIDP
jgi:hypothetical protein